MDLTLVDLLDSCKAEAKAARPVAIKKLEPIPPKASDFTYECEHGTRLTSYMYHALALLPNSYFTGRRKPGCLFCIQYEDFVTIDGLARAIATAHPDMESDDVVRKAITLL